MSGPPLKIAEADLGDRTHTDAVVALLDHYAREPGGGGRPLDAEVRRALPEGLRAHPTTRVWLAWEGERAVGVAVCFLGFSTFAALPLLNLHDLAVRDEARGRGVGRALLGAVEDGARRLGCCKVTLEVLATNERARGLYASYGFRDFAPGGTPTATLFLSKPVDGVSGTGD